MEWLELLKGSKGLEMVLEFCDLHGESELSKYLSITLFITLFILFNIGFYILPTCANMTANKLKQTSIGQCIVQEYCSKHVVPPHKNSGC